MQTQVRRRPTVAKEWQLAVLKNLYSESENPVEEQLLAAAAETGLDEKWVRNWFTRQRSKVTARRTKRKLATSESRQRAQIPTFKLDLRAPNDSRDLASCRTASTSVDPTPSPLTKSPRQPPLVDVRSQSPCLARPAESIPPSYRNISALTHINDPSVNTTRATAIPMYSRDPLCNRYPDFSQFFLPRAQQRPPSFELPTSIDDHNQFVSLPAIPNMDLYTPIQFNLLHPPALPTPPACLGPCPVAFSMRLVDLLSRP